MVNILFIVTEEHGIVSRSMHACISLGLEQRLHSPSYEKSIVERRTIEYLKDRTEVFDDYYYPCRKRLNESSESTVEDPYSLFVFAMNAAQTREKYVTRLDRFFRFINVQGR